MKYTANLNLKKPDGVEPAKIQDVNDNMDTIDQVITEHKAEKTTEVNGVHGLKIEEGIWTPTLAGGTVAGNNAYSKQVGTYVMKNKQMHIKGHIVLSSKDANMSGNVTIAGLPAPVKANSYVSGSIGIASFIKLDTGYSWLGIYTSGGYSAVNIRRNGNNNISQNLQAADITDNTEIAFELFYPID